MGRAPRTKETLPDFPKWRRVTRHPLVFRGLTGSQRTPGFWGVTKILLSWVCLSQSDVKYSKNLHSIHSVLQRKVGIAFLYYQQKKQIICKAYMEESRTGTRDQKKKNILLHVIILLPLLKLEREKERQPSPTWKPNNQMKKRRGTW